MGGNVAIHSTAIVAPSVEIGDGTIVGPFAVVLAPCTIGRSCWIGPHVVVGTTAEHLDAMTVAAVPAEAARDLDEAAQRRIDELVWFGSHGAGVIIGDRSTVREQTTVNQGTHGPTRLGDDVYVMNKSHIGHDAVLGDRVRAAPVSMVGGHAWIGADANLGMASTIHQHRAIGDGAMIGMNATVVDDIGPFQLAKGTPARPSGVNIVGMTRLGFTEADIDALRVHYEDNGVRPVVFDPTFSAWDRARARSEE
jgi:UDP-N-acetylglucosamine acyltransferase